MVCVARPRATYFHRTGSHLKPALQAATQRVELLDVRPIRHGEAPVLQAHHLLGRLVLPDRREELSERSALLLLRLSAQLHR